MTDPDRRHFVEAAFALPIAGLAPPEAAVQTLRSVRAGPFVTKSGESRSGPPLTIGGHPFALTKIAGADVAGRYAAFVLNTPPGRGPELHIHLAQNEWFYLLEGTIGLQCGDQRIVLRAGDSFLAPEGVPHAYVTLGSLIARMINLFDPAGQMEAYFAAYAAIINSIEGAAQHQRVASISPAYGLRVVGPPLSPDLFPS